VACDRRSAACSPPQTPPAIRPPAAAERANKDSFLNELCDVLEALGSVGRVVAFDDGCVQRWKSVRVPPPT
jgi:hypothetical protein